MNTVIAAVLQQLSAEQEKRKADKQADKQDDVSAIIAAVLKQLTAEQQRNGNIDNGALCKILKSGNPCKSTADCPFFTRHGVCSFFHPDAPAGTTGKFEALNDASKQKLTDLGLNPSQRARKNAAR